MEEMFGEALQTAELHKFMSQARTPAHLAAVASWESARREDAFRLWRREFHKLCRYQDLSMRHLEGWLTFDVQHLTSDEAKQASGRGPEKAKSCDRSCASAPAALGSPPLPQAARGDPAPPLPIADLPREKLAPAMTLGDGMSSAPSCVFFTQNLLMLVDAVVLLAFLCWAGIDDWLRNEPCFWSSWQQWRSGFMCLGPSGACDAWTFSSRGFLSNSEAECAWASLSVGVTATVLLLVLLPWVLACCLCRGRAQSHLWLHGQVYPLL